MMDPRRSPSLGAFAPLFNASVPHILEDIFFSLDHASFATCRRVCKTWAKLLSSERYLRRAEELLDEKVNREEELCESAGNGNIQDVTRLLFSGVNRNCESRTGDRGTPLYYAAKKGHQHVVKLLLDVEARSNKAGHGGKTPLCWAAINGHRRMVALLLGAGAKIDRQVLTQIILNWTETSF